VDSTLLVAVISSVSVLTGAVVTAGLTYLLTKRRERDADWRKIKLDLYKAYVIALSGVVRQNRTLEDQTKYADAVNSLTLVASPSVLKALYAFQDEASRHGVDDELEKRRDDLLIALRQDIDPSHSRKAADFSFRFLAPPPPEADTSLDSSSVGP
jgi:hypothetical protein